MDELAQFAVTNSILVAGSERGRCLNIFSTGFVAPDMLDMRIMENTQNNKGNMFRTVVQIQKKNAALTASVPAVAKQTTALETTLETIDTLVQAQEASKKGITLDKTNITRILVNGILGIAGSVAAWASENNKEEVRVKMSLTPTGVAETKDAKIPVLAKMVAEEAAKHDLADYGAGPLALEAFNAKITAYNAIQNAPREAVVAVTGLTKALAEQFVLGDKIVKERLDKLMEQFREPQPQFFAEYKSARSIVDRGGAQGAGTTPAPATSKTPPAPAVA